MKIQGDIDERVEKCDYSVLKRRDRTYSDRFACFEKTSRTFELLGVDRMRDAY